MKLDDLLREAGSDAQLLARRARRNPVNSKSRRPGGELFVVVAVVMVPVMFALFGWFNAQPTSDQSHAPATSPVTVVPAVTEAPTSPSSTTAHAPTAISSPSLRRAPFDIELEPPGVNMNVSALHVGETAEGFPVAAYLDGQLVRMVTCTDVVCESDRVRVDIFKGEGSYNGLRDFVVSSDGRAVSLVEEWGVAPDGGEVLTQYLVVCEDSQCSDRTSIALETDEFLTYSGIALDGDDVLVSFSEFRDGGQPVSGVVRCSAASTCVPEIEGEAGGGGAVAVTGDGEVILLSQEEAVPPTGRLYLRPCGDSRCEFQTKPGGALLGFDIAMSLDDAPRIVAKSVFGEVDGGTEEGLRWGLELIACHDSECEANSALMLHEGGNLEWDVSVDPLGKPVVAWVTDGVVKVARCVTVACLEVVVDEPVETECACGVAVFAADDGWVTLLVSTEDEGLRLVNVQLRPLDAPSPRGVVAEPQPACNGQATIEGALDSTGMAGIEDPSPGLPISISAGPCEGTWTTYNQNHGLPSCVCDLGVSPDGIAWVLSDFGDIATFDGRAWTRLDTAGAWGLRLNVKALDFTEAGTLWILTDRGVWARESGEWIQKGDIEGEDIAVSLDGSVWVYSDGSLHQFDGSSWTEHPRGYDLDPPPEGVGAVAHIDIAPDGTVWVANFNTFDSYDGISWISHLPGRGFTPHGMTVGPDGGIWMASTSNPAFGGSELNIPGLEEDGYGLVRYDGQTWVGYPIPSFTDIAFTSDGSIWAVDAFIGAFRFDGQEWVHYTEEHGLTANQLELVAVAPDGTIWFKTGFRGVVRYQPNS